MQLINDTTLLEMYQTLGNDIALINGTITVTGVFTDKYLEVNALGEMVESTTPIFTCRTSDLTGVINGMTCIINLITYKIETLQADSQGQTAVVLHL